MFLFSPNGRMAQTSQKSQTLRKVAKVFRQTLRKKTRAEIRLVFNKK